MSDIKKNTAFTVDLSFTEADGSPLNISGGTVRFMMKANESDLDAAAIVSKQTGSGVTIVDAALGLAEASVTASDLASISQTKLFCEGAYYVSGQCLARTETVIVTVKTNVIKV